MTVLWAETPGGGGIQFPETDKNGFSDRIIRGFRNRPGKSTHIRDYIHMNNRVLPRFKEKRDYLWITLPDFIDTRNVLTLQNLIESEMLIHPSCNVALDLSNLAMVTSTTVDVIMFFRNMVMEAGGHFCLVNLSQMIVMQLISVNVDRVVTLYESEEDMSGLNVAL